MTDTARAHAPVVPAGLADDHRLAMRRLASTATIITSRSRDCRYGMTATAVTSLTMEPPALLVCVNHAAALHSAISCSGHFCVNVLADTHEALCGIFAGQRRGEERFEFGDWRSDAAGLPYLSDAQAAVFCTVDDRLSYGTHTAFVGRVVDVRVRDTVAPLIHQDGKFGRWFGV